MANFSKIKTRGKLGTPPSASTTKNNLQAPEVAPEASSEAKVGDGRSKRATGRTEPIATRVRVGVRKRYKQIAAREDITMGELLERALDAYEEKENS